MSTLERRVRPCLATPGLSSAIRAAELGAGLMELDRQECMELLAAKAVGRLAYVVDNGARSLDFQDRQTPSLGLRLTVTA